MYDYKSTYVYRYMYVSYGSEISQYMHMYRSIIKLKGKSAHVFVQVCYIAKR